MSTQVHDCDEDAALVERCLGGDGRAWSRLIDRHARVVWSVLMRAGLGQADAEDAFQNAWAVALEELHRLREPSRIRPWIARVARHQAMRIRRRYGIARTAHATLAREDIDRSLPDAELIALERRAYLEDALARLGRKCAELLQRLYLTDRDSAYEVVAADLGVPVGSIGPTRARCLAKLRDRLKGGADA